MAESAFDTHAYFKSLTAAGMPEAQAEVVARRETVRNDDLVTKEYLKKELELIESRLTNKFGAMLVAGLLATIGIILTLLPMVLE